MSWEFEQVAGPYGFTEGPVWDGDGVLFSDMPNDCIRRYDVATGDCEVVHEDTGAANGLKFDDDGRLYACEMVRRRIGRYDGDDYEVVVDHYEGDRFNSPNDLAIEDGVLWFTDPYYDTDWEPDDKELELDHRSVYRLDLRSGGEVERVTTETANPNGLLVSPERDWLYVADSAYGPENPSRWLGYPLDADGTVGEPSVLHNFNPHRGIDGMCLDAAGNLVATAGWTDSGPGPLVYVFEPNGRVVATHPVPDELPTNCAFGGEDLQDLYVTGGSGGLYRARTELTGLLDAP